MFFSIHFAIEMHGTNLNAAETDERDASPPWLSPPKDKPRI
jgi:hypothetical protein